MIKQWSLTQEALDRLLAWLDPDRERAGKRYEEIREDLIRIFIWRGCHEAEDMADETINRVAQKLPELALTYKGDPALYFYGVAKKLLLEYFRRESAGAIATVTDVPDTAEQNAEPDRLTRAHEYLDDCLQKLSQEERELILQYYHDEKRAKIDHRRILAEKQKIDANALRVRVFRIRAKLLKCIEKMFARETV